LQNEQHSISVAYPKLFEEISKNLSSDTTAYLIGGENLRIKGYKETTKDCDLVVTNKQSFLTIVEALKSMGYISIDETVFTTTIARRLYLSETIRRRARIVEFIGSHKLALGILKNEDVFPLKCVTSREPDLEDMIRLVSNPEFNWDIVWSELEKQDKDAGSHVFALY
jgi:hypothetical protein